MHLCACCECANTPQGVSVQTPTRLPPTCVCKSARFTTGGCDVCTFLPLRSCKRCPPRRAPCEGGARACEGPRWEGGCEGGAGGGRGLARLLRGRRIPAPLMQWRPAQLGWGSGDVGCGGGGRHVGVSLCPPRGGWDGGPPPCAVRGAARNAAPPPLTHTPLGAERGGLHTRVGAGGGWGVGCPRAQPPGGYPSRQGGPRPSSPPWGRGGGAGGPRAQPPPPGRATPSAPAAAARVYCGRRSSARGRPGTAGGDTEEGAALRAAPRRGDPPQAPH